MKILSVKQIREADNYTIIHEPIESYDLIQRAAKAALNVIKEIYPPKTMFKVVCGLGNNGADGLALARLLFTNSYENVEVYIVRYSDKVSPHFPRLIKKLNTPKITFIDIKKQRDLKLLIADTDTENTDTVIIDAILGTGVRQPVTGLLAATIEYINGLPYEVVAIDIPSGFNGDALNTASDKVIQADYTITFQYPKLTFMYPETLGYVGHFTIADIGLHAEYINSAKTKNYFITKNDIKQFVTKRPKIAHKGHFGHALLVVGTYGKMGAALLSAKGCMKSGVGLLTVHIPQCGYNILQTAVPEAMASVDSEQNYISDNLKFQEYNAIGVGPGIGTEKQTKNVVKLLIQNAQMPVVFDADAINCIAENKTWLSFIPQGSIFTPHPKEFERLTEKAANSEERLQLQRNFSAKYNVYVVLKGAHTSISAPDGTMYFNSTGNPGMATGGSGDVLTGIITSFMAQGYTSLQSCLLGVYIHGLAGDFAAHEYSEESTTASDIIQHIPTAFKFISS